MKMTTFITRLPVLFFLISTVFSSYSQSDETIRKWRIEIEPLSIYYKGFGGQVMYRVSEKRDLSVGLYSISLDVPKTLKQNMFENVDGNSDTRLGFELAAVARYKIPLFDMESNPVVGAILGWEYFDLKMEGKNDLRITTFIATPYIGYELYLYKKMVYVNPQLRGVFYVAPKSSDEARPEALHPFFLLPTASIGIKL